MTSGGTGDSLWFADVSAWPATDARPARELALALAGAHQSSGPAIPPQPPESPQRPESFAPEPASEWEPAPYNPEPSFEPLPSFVPDPEPAQYGGGLSTSSAGAASDLESFLDAEAQRTRASGGKGKPDSPGKKPKRWKDHRGALIGSAAALIVVLGLGGFGLVRLAGGETEVPAPENPTTTLTDATSSAAGDCPATSSNGTTTGNDAGDQMSGPAVIKAFNYAYYELRSAAKARAVTAPNAVAPEKTMQGFIDQRAAGTRHCLTITDAGNNTYNVVLTELPAGAATPIVYRQLIQTVQTDGKYWIASIKSVK